MTLVSHKLNTKLYRKNEIQDQLVTWRAAAQSFSAASMGALTANRRNTSEQIESIRSVEFTWIELGNKDDRSPANGQKHNAEQSSMCVLVKGVCNSGFLGFAVNVS